MRIPISRRSTLWYFVPGGVGWMEFPLLVLQHFERFQQKRFWDKEAGGQLFWEPTPEGHKRIAAITGPRSTDRRSRYAYKADHAQEQIEIDQKYQIGQYFMGDWHTHPERIARPSALDIQAIKQIYQTSQNPGPGFLLVIVGTDVIERSLSVSWCNDMVTPLDRMNGP